jgi:hypothetical protein
VPRLRQAVLAATDLDATVARLQEEGGLGEPYNDPAVDWFGLRNAVFAIGDTFLEVVSPVREDTAAGRHLERLGSDGGYMLMFQVDDLAEARARAKEAGVREVFEVSGLDDIAEAHFHPADMRGAIVSISEPLPASSWRWGGEGWRGRATAGEVTGAMVAVADPDGVRERWSEIFGAPVHELGIDFEADPEERGVVEIHIASPQPREPVTVGSARLVFASA